MEYTREYRRKIFETLPPELKEAINSTETADALENIANKHSLMLDKMASLGDEVSLFMFGLTKQEDFVKNLSKRLEIPYEKALEVSKDINANILDAVRDSLQEIQTRKEGGGILDTSTTPSTAKIITPLEKAGDFEIVNNKIASSSSQYKETNLNPNKILSDIENPPAPTKVSFVDHLLANPVSTPHTVAEQKLSAPVTPTPTPTPAATPAPQTPLKPVAPQQPSKPSIDPYREPIE